MHQVRLEAGLQFCKRLCVFGKKTKVDFLVGMLVRKRLPELWQFITGPFQQQQRPGGGGRGLHSNCFGRCGGRRSAPAEHNRRRQQARSRLRSKTQAQ